MNKINKENKQKSKYFNHFIKDNKELLVNIDDKKIAITGASGSLGKEVAIFLSQFKKINKIILINISKERLTKVKEEIIELYKDKISDINKKIEIHLCNYLIKEDVNELINYLINENIDIFINIAGIYHLKKTLIEDKIEQTLLINALAPIYIINKLLDFNDSIKIIEVGSISYKYFKLDINDLMSLKSNNLTKRYSNSKRVIMIYLSYLKISSPKYKILITHPGISTTSLFSPRREGYSKYFYKLIIPIMKKIFMNPKKASLSITYGVFSNNYDYKLWIGPKGAFKSFGYPNHQKLSKKLYKNKEFIKSIYDSVNDLINSYYSK